MSEKKSRFHLREHSVAYRLGVLARSTLTELFGLIIYSNRANAEAELALVGSLKLKKQAIPQTEAARQKKNRRPRTSPPKNQKSFRP